MKGFFIDESGDEIDNFKGLCDMMGQEQDVEVSTLFVGFGLFIDIYQRGFGAEVIGCLGLEDCKHATNDILIVYNYKSPNLTLC